MLETEKKPEPIQKRFALEVLELAQLKNIWPLIWLDVDIISRISLRKVA